MTNSDSLVLIIDDTPKNIQVLGTMLRREGYRINVAQNGHEALQSAHVDPPDLILLDIMMPGMDGYEVCQELKKSETTGDIPVIFLTAKTDKTDIIAGFETGAVDYVTKPFHAAELLMRVQSHLTICRLRCQLEHRNRELSRRRQVMQRLFNDACDRLDGPLLGDSVAIRQVQDLIADYSKNDEPVLLVGAPGAGNEAIGRAIHRASVRQGSVFIYVSCRQYQSSKNRQLFTWRALPPDDAKLTMVELATGGSLYLDGVQDLSRESQTQLLEAIAEMDGREPVSSDRAQSVRVIARISPESIPRNASASLNLTLYSRLSRQIVQVPSRHSRAADIPTLVRHYVRKFTQQIGKTIDSVDEQSMSRLVAFSWPGNIRELRNVIEHAIAATTDNVLHVSEGFLSRSGRDDPRAET